MHARLRAPEAVHRPGPVSAHGALRIRVGQHSDKGRKAVNQDFHGALIPSDALLRSKGIAIALADGIGSSDVSQVAAEVAVRALLDDYYCTSHAWSVRKSVERVLAATNAWLHSRTRQGPHRAHDLHEAHWQDRGYVCTLSAIVFKASTAHLFHVGDSRIYRVHDTGLEQLTEDHRVHVAGGESHLSRAMGFNPQLEIDYQVFPLQAGDVFLLASDGVFEHADAAFMASAVRDSLADLDSAARAIVAEALARGSDDNLTVQIALVEQIPAVDAAALPLGEADLPWPPPLAPGMVLDGWQIMRELHASHRSHIHLALDAKTGARAAIKTPSTDARADPAWLERFSIEEWALRRIHNAHVLRPSEPERDRRYQYVATEYIEGCTVAQWLRDRAAPDLPTVRGIAAQVAKGLEALHRLDMLHQDLRPENLMIDAAGTVKIIDLGAVGVAGLAEMAPPVNRSSAGDSVAILGTAQYTAPEYFLGHAGSERSDLFSLAVIVYQMLSGRLPYGTAVSNARTRAAQAKLRYRPVRDDASDIPAWVDRALEKALQPDPGKRQETASEFIHDLSHPNPAFLRRHRPALIERHPMRFWKGVSLVLALTVLVLLFALFGTR